MNAKNTDPYYGLTPLPESEWPEWHNDWCRHSRSTRRLFLLGDHYLVRFVDREDGEDGEDRELWAVALADGSPVWNGNTIWHPTPESALLHAGFDPALLDELRARGKAGDAKADAAPPRRARNLHMGGRAHDAAGPPPLLDAGVANRVRLVWPVVRREKTQRTLRFLLTRGRPPRLALITTRGQTADDHRHHHRDR